MNLKLTITNKDAAEAMAELQEDSVDLIVTSPPYDELRNYSGHRLNFPETAKQISRVLKPGGVCCWNVADAIVGNSETLTSFRQAIYFKDVCLLNVSDTLIWKKLHVAAPNSRQSHQMHEFIFILSKGVPKTFNPIKDRKNKWFGKSPFGQNSKRGVDGKMTLLNSRKPISEFGKRSNVWEGKSRAQENPCAKLRHPAMMPRWLARDLILTWSNPGDLVADPIAGSGTTGIEAYKLGRNVWLNEINPEDVEAMQKDFSQINGGFL